MQLKDVELGYEVVVPTIITDGRLQEHTEA